MAHELSTISVKHAMTMGFDGMRPVSREASPLQKGLPLSASAVVGAGFYRSAWAPACPFHPHRQSRDRRGATLDVMQTPEHEDASQGIEEELVQLLPKLKLHALYLTRSADKADDLLQRTCLRALSRSHQWQVGTRLDRWASTIMNSIWFNELRQKRQRQEQELPEPDLVADRKFESQVEAQLMLSDIRRACSGLSDEDFALITKIHAYGYTYKEVAEELGLPIGTVLSRVSRAKAQIKRAADELRQGGRS